MRLPLTIFVICAASSRAFGYDISSLLEVSYPTELVSAAQGEVIAWISNERGARNVWTARSNGSLVVDMMVAFGGRREVHGD